MGEEEKEEKEKSGEVEYEIEVRVTGKNCIRVPRQIREEYRVGPGDIAVWRKFKGGKLEVEFYRLRRYRVTGGSASPSRIS